MWFTSHQVNSTLANSTDYLLPWYLNYQGGDFPYAPLLPDGWHD